MERLLRVPQGGTRPQLARREVAGKLADLLLFLGQREIAIHAW